MSLFKLLGFTILLVLAGAGAYTAYATMQSRESHPPLGQFVSTDLGQLHVYVDDRTARAVGTAIVLLHGASSNLREFEHGLIPALQKLAPVAAVDRPGHGYSERVADQWPDPASQAHALKQALDAVGIQRPVLVGHSLSGAIVLAYALQYPNDIRGAVLLAGATHPWKSGVAWHRHLAGLPILGEVFARTLVVPISKAVAPAAIQHVFWPEAVPDNYMRDSGMGLSVLPGPYRASAEDVRLLSDYLKTQSRRYATLETPLLLISGDLDAVVPAWNHTARLAGLPNAKVILLKGAGHGLHHTRIADIARHLETFLSNHP